jgi:hypothetical protein
MTYLKYANLCAEVLRGSLKEPFLSKARRAPEPGQHGTGLEGGVQRPGAQR